MKFAAFFLWILVPLGLWLAVALWGTPHVMGTYTYAGSSYRPPEHRYYQTCTYYGWAGAITVSATDGQCSWIRFFKAGS